MRVEAESTKVAGENLKLGVSNAIIVLFPDIRTTGGKLGYVGKSGLTKEFRDTIEKLLARYKRQDFRTIGVLYRDSTPETLSGLYPESSFDELIKMDTDFKQWTRERYEEELPSIIKALNLTPGAQVIVGGYHSKDCVVSMTAALLKESFNASTDLRLTDQLSFLLLSHKARRMLPEGARDGSITWRAIKQEQEGLVKRKIADFLELK